MNIFEPFIIHIPVIDNTNTWDLIEIYLNNINAYYDYRLDFGFFKHYSMHTQWSAVTTNRLEFITPMKGVTNHAVETIWNKTYPKRYNIYSEESKYDVWKPFFEGGVLPNNSTYLNIADILSGLPSNKSLGVNKATLIEIARLIQYFETTRYIESVYNNLDFSYYDYKHFTTIVTPSEILLYDINSNLLAKLDLIQSKMSYMAFTNTKLEALNSVFKVAWKFMSYMPFLQSWDWDRDAKWAITQDFNSYGQRPHWHPNTYSFFKEKHIPSYKFWSDFKKEYIQKYDLQNPKAFKSKLIRIKNPYAIQWGPGYRNIKRNIRWADSYVNNNASLPILNKKYIELSNYATPLLFKEGVMLMKEINKMATNVFTKRSNRDMPNNPYWNVGITRVDAGYTTDDLQYKPGTFNRFRYFSVVPCAPVMDVTMPYVNRSVYANQFVRAHPRYINAINIIRNTKKIKLFNKMKDLLNWNMGRFLIRDFDEFAFGHTDIDIKHLILTKKYIRKMAYLITAYDQNIINKYNDWEGKDDGHYIAMRLSNRRLLRKVISYYLKGYATMFSDKKIAGYFDILFHPHNTFFEKIQQCAVYLLSFQDLVNAKLDPYDSVRLQILLKVNQRVIFLHNVLGKIITMDLLNKHSTKEDDFDINLLEEGLDYVNSRGLNLYKKNVHNLYKFINIKNIVRRKFLKLYKEFRIIQEQLFFKKELVKSNDNKIHYILEPKRRNQFGKGIWLIKNKPWTSQLNMFESKVQKFLINLKHNLKSRFKLFEAEYDLLKEPLNSYSLLKRRGRSKRLNQNFSSFYPYGSSSMRHSPHIFKWYRKLKMRHWFNWRRNLDFKKKIMPWRIRAHLRLPRGAQYLPLYNAKKQGNNEGFIRNENQYLNWTLFKANNKLDKLDPGMIYEYNDGQEIKSLSPNQMAIFNSLYGKDSLNNKALDWLKLVNFLKKKKKLLRKLNTEDLIQRSAVNPTIQVSDLEDFFSSEEYKDFFFYSATKKNEKYNFLDTLKIDKYLEEFDTIYDNFLIEANKIRWEDPSVETSTFKGKEEEEFFGESYFNHVGLIEPIRKNYPGIAIAIDFLEELKKTKKNGLLNKMTIVQNNKLTLLEEKFIKQLNLILGSKDYVGFQWKGSTYLDDFKQPWDEPAEISWRLFRNILGKSSIMESNLKNPYDKNWYLKNILKDKVQLSIVSMDWEHILRNYDVLGENVFFNDLLELGRKENYDTGFINSEEELFNITNKRILSFNEEDFLMLQEYALRPNINETIPNFENFKLKDLYALKLEKETMTVFYNFLKHNFFNENYKLSNLNQKIHSESFDFKSIMDLKHLAKNYEYFRLAQRDMAIILDTELNCLKNIKNYKSPLDWVKELMMQFLENPIVSIKFVNSIFDLEELQEDWIHEKLPKKGTIDELELYKKIRESIAPSSGEKTFFHGFAYDKPLRGRAEIFYAKKTIKELNFLDEAWENYLNSSESSEVADNTAFNSYFGFNKNQNFFKNLFVEDLNIIDLFAVQNYLNENDMIEETGSYFLSENNELNSENVFYLYKMNPMAKFLLNSFNNNKIKRFIKKKRFKKKDFFKMSQKLKILPKSWKLSKDLINAQSTNMYATDLDNFINESYKDYAINPATSSWKSADSDLSNSLIDSEKNRDLRVNTYEKWEDSYSDEDAETASSSDSYSDDSVLLSLLKWENSSSSLDDDALNYKPNPFRFTSHDSSSDARATSAEKWERSFRKNSTEGKLKISDFDYYAYKKYHIEPEHFFNGKPWRLVESDSSKELSTNVDLNVYRDYKEIISNIDFNTYEEYEDSYSENEDILYSSSDSDSPVRFFPVMYDSSSEKLPDPDFNAYEKYDDAPFGISRSSSSEGFNRVSPNKIISDFDLAAYEKYGVDPKDLGENPWESEEPYDSFSENSSIEISSNLKLNTLKNWDATTDPKDLGENSWELNESYDSFLWDSWNEISSDSDLSNSLINSEKNRDLRVNAYEKWEDSYSANNGVSYSSGDGNLQDSSDKVFSDNLLTSLSAKDVSNSDSTDEITYSDPGLAFESFVDKVMNYWVVYNSRFTHKEPLKPIPRKSNSSKAIFKKIARSNTKLTKLGFFLQKLNNLNINSIISKEELEEYIYSYSKLKSFIYKIKPLYKTNEPKIIKKKSILNNKKLNFDSEVGFWENRRKERSIWDRFFFYAKNFRTVRNSILINQITRVNNGGFTPEWLDTHSFNDLVTGLNRESSDYRKLKLLKLLNKMYGNKQISSLFKTLIDKSQHKVHRNQILDAYNKGKLLEFLRDSINLSHPFHLSNKTLLDQNLTELYSITKLKHHSFTENHNFSLAEENIKEWKDINSSCIYMIKDLDDILKNSHWGECTFNDPLMWDEKVRPHVNREDLLQKLYFNTAPDEDTIYNESGVWSDFFENSIEKINPLYDKYLYEMSSNKYNKNYQIERREVDAIIPSEVWKNLTTNFYPYTHEDSKASFFFEDSLFKKSDSSFFKVPTYNWEIHLEEYNKICRWLNHLKRTPVKKESIHTWLNSMKWIAKNNEIHAWLYSMKWIPKNNGILPLFNSFEENFTKEQLSLFKTLAAEHFDNSSTNLFLSSTINLPVNSKLVRLDWKRQLKWHFLSKIRSFFSQDCDIVLKDPINLVEELDIMNKFFKFEKDSWENKLYLNLQLLFSRSLIWDFKQHNPTPVVVTNNWKTRILKFFSNSPFVEDHVELLDCLKSLHVYNSRLINARYPRNVYYELLTEGGLLNPCVNLAWEERLMSTFEKHSQRYEALLKMYREYNLTNLSFMDLKAGQEDYLKCYVFFTTILVNTRTTALYGEHIRFQRPYPVYVRYFEHIVNKYKNICHMLTKISYSPQGNDLNLTRHNVNSLQLMNQEFRTLARTYNENVLWNNIFILTSAEKLCRFLLNPGVETLDFTNDDLMGSDRLLARNNRDRLVVYFNNLFKNQE